MKLHLAIAVLFVFSCQNSRASNQNNLAAATATNSNEAALGFQVGAPELVFDTDITRPGGGLPNIADSGFFTIKLSDGWIRGYSANGVTAVFEGSPLEKISRPDTGPALSTNGKEYETCGTWLFSAYLEPTGLVRGWYHAESHCDYSIGQSHHALAYVSSESKGLIFGDSNEERGEILTSTVEPTQGKITGIGGGSVVRFGDYFYAYFDDQTLPDHWHTGIARSPYAQGGKPGTWTKFYDKAFTEPGLLGKSAPNPSIGGITAMMNRSEKMVLGVGYNFPGLAVAWSNNAVDFVRAPDSLLLADTNIWSDRNAYSGELLAYPSFVAKDGGHLLGDSFWLYYTYVPHGLDLDHPLIVRRSIQLFTPSKDKDAPTVRVAITNYIDPATSRQQTTSGLVRAPLKPVGTLGYLSTRAAPNTKGLLECVLKASSDNSQITVTTDAKCPQDTFRVRLAGYLWSQSQSNTKPIYTCRNQDGLSSYLSLKKSCIDGNAATPIGFIGE